MAIEHEQRKKHRGTNIIVCCMRRSVILAGLVVLAGTVGAAGQNATPPFPHVIINNDLAVWSNVFGYTSGQSADADPVSFVQNMFLQSVAAGDMPGIDAQSLSVQYSMFPWWHSSLYSWQDHDNFLRGLAYYSRSTKSSGYPGDHPSPGRTYMESGHDFVKDFIDFQPAANAPNQLRILNFRLNDYHYNWNYELYKTQSKEQIVAAAKAGQSPICDSKSVANVDIAEMWTQTAFTGYFDGLWTGTLAPTLDGRCAGSLCLAASDVRNQCANHACVIVSPNSRCPEITLDFSIPVVRHLKLMQLLDLVKTYKFAAIEIDFDRMPQLFRTDLDDATRTQIMSSWLVEVRSAIAAVNPNLLIGIRVPSRQAHRALVGIDLSTLDRNRLVDYVILAAPYISDQQIDYDINPYSSSFKVYAEMTDIVSNVVLPDALKSLAAQHVVTSAKEQPTSSRALLTAAHLAYVHGAMGMALFNAQYYMHLNSNIPVLPMPAEAFRCMASPACVANTDQEYFLTLAHYNLPRVGNMLPMGLSGRAPIYRFSMDLAAPSHQWRAQGGLLQLALKLPDQATIDDYRELAKDLSVRFNGHPATPAPQATWPAAPMDAAVTNTYIASLWTHDPELSPMFSVDPSTLVNGENSVEIDYHPRGQPVSFSVVAFDLYLPANP